jgi:hypothetical protein
MEYGQNKSMEYDPDKRKLFSALCHGSIFFSSFSLFLSIGVPIALLLVSDDPLVKENAKESINFHINVFIYGVIIGIIFLSPIGSLLTLLTLGLFWLLGAAIGAIFFLFHTVPPLFGIYNTLTNPNQSYRYPFIFRFV